MGSWASARGWGPLKTWLWYKDFHAYCWSVFGWWKHDNNSLSLAGSWEPRRFLFPAWTLGTLRPNLKQQDNTKAQLSKLKSLRLRYSPTIPYVRTITPKITKEFGNVSCFHFSFVFIFWLLYKQINQAYHTRNNTHTGTQRHTADINLVRMWLENKSKIHTCKISLQNYRSKQKAPTISFTFCFFLFAFCILW